LSRARRTVYQNVWLLSGDKSVLTTIAAVGEKTVVGGTVATAAQRARRADADPEFRGQVFVSGFQPAVEKPNGFASKQLLSAEWAGTDNYLYHVVDVPDGTMNTFVVGTFNESFAFDVPEAVQVAGTPRPPGAIAQQGVSNIC